MKMKDIKLGDHIILNNKEYNYSFSGIAQLINNKKYIWKDSCGYLVDDRFNYLWEIIIK